MINIEEFKRIHNDYVTWKVNIKKRKGRWRPYFKIEIKVNKKIIDEVNPYIYIWEDVETFKPIEKFFNCENSSCNRNCKHEAYDVLQFYIYNSEEPCKGEKKTICDLLQIKLASEKDPYRYYIMEGYLNWKVPNETGDDEYEKERNTIMKITEEMLDCVWKNIYNAYMSSEIDYEATENSVISSTNISSPKVSKIEDFNVKRKINIK